MVPSEKIACPWEGKDDEIVAWLKKYPSIVYHEYGEKEAKPHYQGLLGTKNDTTKFLKNVNDNFRFVFKATGKLTGMKSFSKEWKSDEHLSNFKDYMTKGNTLVYNTLFNESELNIFKENYLKKKQEKKLLKDNPQKKSNDFITYIKSKFSRKTALNETIIDFKPKYDVDKLIEYTHHYIYGERVGRNGCEYVIRSYCNLAMYHLTDESRQVLIDTQKEKVKELLSY
jgi:hypothetical protein